MLSISILVMGTNSWKLWDCCFSAQSAQKTSAGNTPLSLWMCLNSVQAKSQSHSSNQVMARPLSPVPRETILNPNKTSCVRKSPTYLVFCLLMGCHCVLTEWQQSILLNTISSNNHFMVLTFVNYDLYLYLRKLSDSEILRFWDSALSSHIH